MNRFSSGPGKSETSSQNSSIAIVTMSSIANASPVPSLSLSVKGLPPPSQFWKNSKAPPEPKFTAETTT